MAKFVSIVRVKLNLHKKYLKRVAKKVSREVLEHSTRYVKKEKQLSEIAYRSYFKVVILADNKKPQNPSKTVLKLQDAIQGLGFPCNIGTGYYNRLKGRFEEDVEKEIEKNDLIVLINGDRPALVGESKKTRLTHSWKKKTLFFFKYKTPQELVKYAENKEFPIDFKFPIPYQNIAQLKAMVLFGVLHIYYYKFRRGQLTVPSVEADKI